MKLPLKFAGVLTIVLIAFQPVFSGCTSGNIAGCVSACLMGQAGMGNMSKMGPDCPMTNGDLLNDCSQGCCSQAAAQSVLQWASPGRPRLILANTVALLSYHVSEPAQAFALRPAYGAPAASPPRHILYQVFRI